MRNRSQLHRTKIDEFREWLTAKGYELLEPKGDYEVMRWRGNDGKPMPIVFDRLQGDHFTVNETASGYVKTWLKERRK